LGVYRSRDFGGIFCCQLQSKIFNREWENSIDTGVMRSRIEAVEVGEK
jgi:hypothetical protein